MSTAASPSLRLQAALFDVDGTMADTDVHHREVFKELLEPFNISCDHEYYNTHISGRANALIAEELLPQLPKEEATKLFIHKETLFRERAEKLLEPLPGLLDLMKTLRSRGVRVAAVTNAPKPNVEMMLRVLHVQPLLEEVVLGEDCTEAKPSPVPYQVGMDRFGDALEPARCVVFEDSLPGVKAGVAAGCVVVGVRTTQDDATLRKAGAAYTIADYTDLDVEKMMTELKDFVR